MKWPVALLFVVGAVACFHVAYAQTAFGPLHLFILGYVACLVQLARLKTSRQSFYAGLATGFLCVAPQLTCFWNIFGPAAIVLWIILAFWIGAFTGMTHAALERFGPNWTAVLIPFFWMGLEYFRSELYYLKFSWLNVGYGLSNGLMFEMLPFQILGIYGIGFLAALCAALFLVISPPRALIAMFILIIISAAFTQPLHMRRASNQIHIAGVQLEFPNEHQISTALDALIARHTNANIVVLSEYTLDGPVPDSLKAWCRDHHRYLVVGGKDPAPKNNFYDTAFVVGPEGEIVFRQVKSVPIQFFKDGLPAPEQKVWDSPWGKIGFCVCYDLSYTRVIDGLVKQGAQLLIVPTMDVADWGEHQHQLHALIAPVRAAEYGVPVFRLASSGISQAVQRDGETLATAPFPGEGSELFANITMANHPSIPLDRFLAPVAVGLTGAFFIFFCLPKKKSSGIAGAEKSETVLDEKSEQPVTPS